MANALSVNEFKKLPKSKYEEIRNELQTGDLVFCSGSYMFSKIIKRLTRSSWSHVGIIYKDEKLNRIMVLESEVLIGVRLVPLSFYIKNYKYKGKPYFGKLCIAKVNSSLTNINEGISHGLDQLGRPYDNYEIFRILFRILFKRSARRYHNKSFICSELIRDIYNHADVKINLKDGFISPENVWTNKHVSFLYRLL